MALLISSHHSTLLSLPASGLPAYGHQVCNSEYEGHEQGPAGTGFWVRGC